MIPDPTVDEVRDRADIVAVVGEHVPLERAGKEYKALCPFHEERTPSFYVVPDKGFYKCFGCGASGDVFSFVMKHLGLDFVEAVKHVGARSGVEVREVRKGSKEEDPHRDLYEANAFARTFYRNRILDPDEGRGAREYLEGRGIDEETAERFGLGYAPDGWRALREAAAKHGIDDEVLRDAGLLSESDRSPEPYDRFRNRIVFPIETAPERVVGFGGRIVGEAGEGVPKYLNSPESPIYHKGRILYGLSWARHAIRREEAALVVEGYMDVVALAAEGLEHGVAPLGTSMTSEQARLLARYCTRVYLLFDSDPAGLRATFRAADILLEAGLHPAVVTLPPGEDPDTVVRSDGAEAIRRHLEEGVDVLDRKLQILEERAYFSTIEGVREAVDRLLPTIRAAADPALRDIYVAKVSERTGVRRETLEEELARSSGPRHRRGRGERPKGRRRGGGRGRSETERTLTKMGAERELLRLALRDPEGVWIEEAAEEIGPDDFVDPACRELYRALLDDSELRRVPEGMSAGAARLMEELLSGSGEVSHTRRIFRESLNMIRRKPLDQTIDELRGLLHEADERGDEERVRTLLDELEALTRRRREMGEGWESAARKALRVTGVHDEYE